MCVQPALENDGGGELVDHVAAGIAVRRIVAGGQEGSVGLGGGEALVPEMDGEGWVIGFAAVRFGACDAE